MALSIAGGAAQGLESILEERFKQALETQRIKEAESQMQLQRDRLSQTDSQFGQELGLQRKQFGETKSKNEFDRKMQAANMRRVLSDDEQKLNQQSFDNAMKGTTMANQNNQADTQRSFVAGENALDRQHDTSMLGQRLAGAGGATPSAGPNNLAAMVAQNPSMLQGLTPTMSGQVLNDIANNPEIKAQYEATRMAPLRERAQEIIGGLNQLVTVDETTGQGQLTPGARSIFGEYTPTMARDFIPGQEATDANAALKQVVGQQIVDLMAEMKAQSRTGATGFGALSERELDVLQSAATQLTQRISEPNALNQLLSIHRGLQKILQDAPGTGLGAGVQVTGAAAAPAAGGVNVNDLRSRYGY